MNRRNFIQLMGLASGASLVNSCVPERQTDKLIPYLVPPEDGVLPGQAVYYSTTCTECPASCGVLARVRDHRPVKLEGIASHPISDGGLCVRGQASLSRLYHPERLKRPLRREGDGFVEISWDEAYAIIDEALRSVRGGGTATLANVYLAGRTTGSLSALIDRFSRAMGVERVPEFEPFAHAAIRQVNEKVFKRAEIPDYRVDEADFLLTVGADILECFVSPVSYAARFAAAKRRHDFSWHHVEPHVTLTGLQAEKRYGIAPGGEAHVLAHILGRILASSRNSSRIESIRHYLPRLPERGVVDATGLSIEQLDHIADKLISAKRPLMIVGGVSTMQQNGMETALLTALIQWITEMVDSTIDFNHAENYDHVGTMNDVRNLGRRLARGEIGVIFVSRADFVNSMPEADRLVESLGMARLRVGLGDFMTDTMEHCDVILPLSHSLESWGDAEPRRGLTTVIQPTIEPIFDTRTEGDVLLEMMRAAGKAAPAATYQDYVFGRWRSTMGAAGIEKLLADGSVERRGIEVPVGFDIEEASKAMGQFRFSEVPKPNVLYAVPSIRVLDGRSARLPLLSEVPDPVTTVSYGDYLSVSPDTAADMKLEEKDEVLVSGRNWTATLPVKIQPGLHRGVMTVALASVKGLLAETDARNGEIMTRHDGVTVERTGNKIALPVLSGSLSQEGRGIIPMPGHSEHAHHDGPTTMYGEKHYKDYRWGMTIDLDLCTGCSACSAACYIENNLPVVGPKEHLKGREMSWIRVEPFYDEEGGAEFQPMLCQHCTNAPCETVCPVYAAYHNHEGLNAQVYNRCVGTRYCANNCPYKVRRFNWFDHKRPAPLDRMVNPDVSVRGRGVMEKCTFCVQRIRSAKDKAKDEKRKVQDGEVTTACAQSCPTKAIAFGNLLDKDSEVYKLSRSDRVHRVLEPLGTEPAVYYLGNKWAKKKNGKHG